jgi:superfamily II DNA or RNA helicase
LKLRENSFKRGDRVRDTYSERLGFITGKTSPFGESLRWQVGFGDGEPEYIRESYLELISDDDDMFSLFEQCRFNGVIDLRRIIQQIRLNGNLTNLFYSMRNSSTKFMQHQFKPVMKFIESATGRLLIADEVGLGKTIEAIYIWKELLTRENAKRFLIVCPAQLCQKWKDDLWRYFGIQSVILGAKELLQRLNETLVNYNSDNFVLISSIQGIRYKEKENSAYLDHSSRSSLNDFLETFDAENNQELFDLVVIDEAHYLRNSSTASYNTGEKLRDIARYMILLSATPIQTSSKNLYNLLKLLSPEDFYNSDIFDEMLKENRSLVLLANAIRDNKHPKEDILDLYNAVKDKLQANVVLNKKIQAFIKNPDNTIEERMALFHCIKDSNFYSQYFIRTRKRDVFENRITRTAETLAFNLSDEEYRKYTEVTNYLKKLSVNSSVSKIFTLIARQRQMTSCLPAALKHWKDNDVMRDMIYEDMGLDDDGEYFNVVNDDIPLIETPEGQIARFTLNDSKYNKLLSAITELLSENAQEKIIIFSYYRYTIHYLYSRLTQDGFNCEKMMGGMGDEKDDIIDHFKNAPSCNILISSEVGSEGIDLQFASIEINYDLPWNPMRLEQRIGRIDRIGQEKDKIRILNFICQNTIEDRVIERLYDRIEIFKYSIGDIEEILGDKIHQLSIRLLTSNLSDQDKEEQAFQTIEAIANNKIDMEKLEEQAGLSAEFSDTILQNINNADKNKRYIMAEELIQYTEDFFASNYSGTRIEENDKNSRIITLSTEAQLEFRDFIRTNHYQTPNLGYRTDGVLCIFNGNRDSYKKWKIIELIDINHPFVKWMKYKNQSKSFSNYSCSALKVKKDTVGGIFKGLYAYYIQRWSSEGYRNTNELKYFIIETDTKNILDESIAEGFIHTSLNQGEYFSEIKYGLQNFETICYSLNKCKEHVNSLFAAFETNFYNENDMICERNVQYLKKTFERKKESIMLQIEKAHQNKQSDRIIRMHEGKLKKNEETYKIQLAKLEAKQKGRCNFADIAVGLIKVED